MRKLLLNSFRSRIRCRRLSTILKGTEGLTQGYYKNTNYCLHYPKYFSTSTAIYYHNLTIPDFASGKYVNYFGHVCAGNSTDIYQFLRNNLCLKCLSRSFVHKRGHNIRKYKNDMKALSDI